MQKNLSTLIFIVGFILGDVVAVAQRGPPDVLNPRMYTSPSGEFVLTVDPSDLYGQGEGDYRVTRKGAVVWEGKKPFTLYEAGITDDGLIAGYAYTHGLDGYVTESGNKGPGDFHVVIMRATGERLLHEVTQRTHSLYLHTLPKPLAQGVLVDGAKDRLVVVVQDEELNRREKSYWTYQLSSGRRQSKSSSGPSVARTVPVAETKPAALPKFPNRPLKLVARRAGELAPPPQREIKDVAPTQQQGGVDH